MRQIYSSDPDTELFFAAHGYRNEEFDALAESRRVTVEEDQRRQMLARMQEMVAEDLPLLVLYYPAPFLIRRKGGSTRGRSRTPRPCTTPRPPPRASSPS
jgi:ABC-type transport system substrate-binding protein